MMKALGYTLAFTLFTAISSHTVADKFGVPVISNGVANLAIGKWNGEASYRIKADKTGYITGFTYNNRHDSGAGGYSLGTGGKFLVRLVENDPSSGSNLPDTNSVVLAQAEIANLLSFNGIIQIDFDAPAYIEEGNLYHLWFVNSDSNFLNNWSSINNLNPTEAYNPTQPAYDDENQAVLYRYDGSNGVWYHNGKHTPIYKFHFDDGAMQSQGYIGAWRTSGNRQVKHGYAVRQLIENVEETFVANKLHFALKKFGSPGSLKIIVKETNGSNSKNFYVQDHLINSDNSQVRWHTRTNSSYTFEAGKSYYIEFYLPVRPPTEDDYYEFFPIQDGSHSYGFVNGGTLSNGYAQYRESFGAWNDGWRKHSSSSLRKDGDLMVYFD